MAETGIKFYYKVVKCCQGKLALALSLHSVFMWMLLNHLNQTSQRWTLGLYVLPHFFQEPWKCGSEYQGVSQSTTDCSKPIWWLLRSGVLGKRQLCVSQGIRVCEGRTVSSSWRSGMRDELPFLSRIQCPMKGKSLGAQGLCCLWSCGSTQCLQAASHVEQNPNKIP